MSFEREERSPNIRAAWTASPARLGFWEKYWSRTSLKLHKSLFVQTGRVGACGASSINDLTTPGGLTVKNGAVEMRTAWTASPARLGFLGKGFLSLRPQL
ncbi:hypothetical protein BDZ89DRAFT_545407 [Hymenopellis radicata]|nr:hypothetical protein BDZ89DRAFT_545407 [Hymenopellis radicata]